jgi:agmatine deiminase
MTTEGERRWPAEWESHKATIITYPHNRTTFRSNCEPAAKQYRAVARAIAQFEDVLLFCNTKELADRARKELDSEGGAQRIHILIAPSDDSWCRDSGPTFIIESSSSGGKRLVGLDWNFNAYGGPKEACYWPCNKDQALKKHICDAAAHLGLSVQCLKVPLVLEGGSIHTDGEGTVLTTEECLLNPNRNPDMTKQEIQNTILEALGCSKMIWLPRGIAADNDTNGHVDNFAMFARPGEVILSWCDDPSDENYDRCHEAMKVLEREVDAKGRKLTVHKLPCPPPMVSCKLRSRSFYRSS